MTVVSLLAHRDREGHAKSAYEVPALITVVDDGVDHANRLLTSVEIQPHNKRQPLAVAFYAAMFPFDLRDSTHGPDCSIVTRSTLVEYFSRGGAFSALPSGPSCRIQMSRPSRATSRPSTAIDSMRLAPDLGIRTFNFPVVYFKRCVALLDLHRAGLRWAMQHCAGKASVNRWSPDRQQ